MSTVAVPTMVARQPLLTASDLGATVDHPDLGAKLVQEHHGALRLGERSRDLSHGLRPTAMRNK